VLAAVVFAAAALGPGSISLDRVFGIDWAGLEWAIGATVIGGLGGLSVVALARFLRRTQRGEPHAQAA
jgi:hypothetical protein